MRIWLSSNAIADSLFSSALRSFWIALRPGTIQDLGAPCRKRNNEKYPSAAETGSIRRWR